MISNNVLYNKENKTLILSTYFKIIYSCYMKLIIYDGCVLLVYLHILKRKIEYTAFIGYILHVY